MDTIRRVLGWQIAKEVTAARFAQMAIYVGAFVFFILGIMKVARLQLTEAERFFGTLHVGAVLLILMCFGTLVRIHVELTKRNDQH